MRAKRKRQQTKCAACRASAYAAECGDEHLATVIKMHLPPHTCTSPQAEAAEAAKAAEAAEAADAYDALSLKAIDIVAFNHVAERKFVELARRLVPCAASHLIRETAYVLDVSTETAKRYLLKHSASNAEFAIVRGVVVLRSVV